MKIKYLLTFGLLYSAVPAGAWGNNFAREHISFMGEFVYMRHSDMQKHPLVDNSAKFQCPNACPHYTVINTKALINDFDFEPGWRAAVFLNPNVKNGIEGNFLYLQPWTGEKSRHANATLFFPFTHPGYSTDFIHASEAHTKYVSHFWTGEVNYWRYFTPRNIDYFSLSGIFGARYFRLTESFKLTMIRPPDKSTYSIHTKNHVYGAQLGLDFQMNPTNWLSWEAYAKVGVFGNKTDQKQFMGDLDNTVVLRDSERDKTQWGYFADVNAQVGFRFLRHFYLHAGYEMIFLTGLAIAPEQVDRHTRSSAGRKDYTHGNAIIHGMFGGLTFSF